MRKGKFEPISNDIRDKLHWLPIQQRIKFKIGVLVYRCLHGTAPPYLSEMLHAARGACTTGVAGATAPMPFVYGGSARAKKCPFPALVQYLSERLSFSQDGVSLTLAHLEGYCLAPADIQQGRLHQKGSGGCPCGYWVGQRNALSFFCPIQF